MAGGAQEGGRCREGHHAPEGARRALRQVDQDPHRHARHRAGGGAAQARCGRLASGRALWIQAGRHELGHVGAARCAARILTVPVRFHTRTNCHRIPGGPVQRAAESHGT
eukprot:4592518-Prymnesium_polylepis.2